MRTFDWDVVVLGGANMDYLVRGERLPRPGETTQGDALDEAPGGKGANQAVAAARLGARVAFVGRVGADPRGELSIQALAREGIDTSRVRRDPGALTGVALILVDRQGEKLIGVAPGANARVGEEDLRAAAPLIESARVLLLQLELPVPIVERAAEMARSAGSRVVLDAAPPRAVADSLVRQLDVVRANAGEARALTGVEVEDFSSARAAADALLARGAGAAVGGAVAHRLRSRSDTGGEQERHAPCTLASVWGYVMQAVLGRHSGIIYALMRLMVGLLFACHGAQKLLGFPNGQKVALGSLMGLAGVIELVGGLMVAAGLFAGPVAFICSGEMAAAYFMAHFPKGFWPILNQGELAVVYCFVFLYIASRGSGAYGLK